MSFENDIFISYAHIDNQTFQEGQQGWIASLHRALELRVAQLSGQPLKIWRDPKLQGNDAFADRLVAEVPKTALLVSVLSPRYLRSEWCRRELDTFITGSETTGGLRIRDKSRVFKVVKTPIPLAGQSPVLQQLLGYEFYLLDPETGRPTELNPDEPEIRRHYWAKLDDLAHDICQMLELLHADVDAASADDAAQAAAAEEPESVYLAETSFDLKAQHDALKRDLVMHGYQVLPAEPLPRYAEELAALVRAALARCRLSILLVGNNYGFVPEGASESAVMLQNELAIERSSSHDFTRLLWLPPDLQTSDERQLRFIEQLRTDARLQTTADLLEGSLESLKTEVRLRLEPPEEEADKAACEKAPGDGDDDLTRIYLIYDQRDAEPALAVEDHLFDRGFEVIVPAFDGDEAQVRLDHEENLCACDAVLLYYGAGPELWLRRKLREVQKSPGFGRTRPLVGKAIYVAPPDQPHKARLRTREALLIRGGETFEPDSLAPFIRQIAEAKTR
ncbi:MAG: TIR domain-containing protein [bacterium]|nr:TIR domain-containing protein [bacterium]